MRSILLTVLSNPMLLRDALDQPVSDLNHSVWAFRLGLGLRDRHRQLATDHLAGGGLGARATVVGARLRRGPGLPSRRRRQPQQRPLQPHPLGDVTPYPASGLEALGILAALEHPVSLG